MGANDAALTAGGNRDGLRITQGDRAGPAGASSAGLTVHGSDNLAEVVQEGRNNLTLTIRGERNNHPARRFTGTGPLPPGADRQAPPPASPAPATALPFAGTAPAQ